jgi:ribonuclease Z
LDSRQSTSARIARKTAKRNQRLAILRLAVQDERVREGWVMKNLSIALVSALGFGVLIVPSAQAAPCMRVTITGSVGGPQAYQGSANAGTLVDFGDDTNNCRAVRLQFDAGRGTLQRLSQIPVTSAQLNAVFFTHMHNDHSEGFIDLLQNRWHFFSSSPKIDVVCAEDASTIFGVPISCRNFVAHIADALIQSGEIAQRRSEDRRRLEGGPAAMTNMMAFQPKDEPQEVWSSGVVKVSAIRSTHIPGHASYRVDTPAGSVVIGGDAGNDTLSPPRPSSTSAQVEALARGADVIVHSTMHPVMGPDRESGMPPLVFYRQSTAPDLGAMAQRTGAKVLVLTHLSPPTGTAQLGPWTVPGGPLGDDDYSKSARDGGFEGEIIVAKDLVTFRLPAK